MTAVAIVGADGAGKTTIAKALETSSSLPVKYIYMGANIESSNYALPTSRLILFVKRQRFRRVAKREGITDPAFLSTHHEAHRAVKYRGALSTLRMLNRLAEASYRHLITWLYQRRGFVVVHDRHLLYDTVSATGVRPRRFSERAYRWVLRNMYTEPDLVVFLDAPSEVLYARKGEGTLEDLDQRRRAFLQQGRSTRNFVRVDAAQPLDQVLREVDRCISDVCRAPSARA